MFSFFKNKSSVFLILVITLSVSLSSFSNTFTALSSAIFNAPKASAATGVTITGYSNSNPAYSLCLYGAGQSSANATVVSSGSSSNNISASLPVQPLPKGSTYTLLVIDATNSCYGNKIGREINFISYPNHISEIKVSYDSRGGLSKLSSEINNQSPYITSNGGNTVINFCLGKTDPVNIELTDPDGDNLEFSVTPYLYDGLSYTSSQSAGKLIYTIYPSLSNVRTTGFIPLPTSMDGLPIPTIFTAREVADSYRSASGDETRVNVNFNVIKCDNSSLSSSSISYSPITSSSIYSNISSISNYYPPYYSGSNNGLSYSCQGGNFSSDVYGNYFYNAIIGGFCNIFWSGYFYPSNGPINYYPPVYSTSSSSYVYNPSSIAYSSITQEPVYTSSSVQSPAPLSLIQPVISSSVDRSSVPSSSVIVSSIANNPTSYSVIPNCPVNVNDSINYYGGGHISLQNNSPYSSNNLSANINLPVGVTVYGLEKGYNFYQNGNNLNISFPEVGAYGEISTFYTTNYSGRDYNSSTVINCNQVTNPRVSSAVAASSSVINLASTISISSSSTAVLPDCPEGPFPDENSCYCSEPKTITFDPTPIGGNDHSHFCKLVKLSPQGLPVCDGEVVMDVKSCICSEPRQFVDTSAEADHYHICKILEVVNISISSSSSIPEVVLSSSSTTQSTNSISVSLIKPPFCESPNLVLSTDQKLCVCPIAGQLIYIVKDSNGKEESICRDTIPEAIVSQISSSSSSAEQVEVLSSSSSSSSLSSNSSSGFKGCEDSDLVLTVDGKFCKCPKAGELIYIKKDANGKEDSICSATNPFINSNASSSTSSSISTISNLSSVSSSSTVEIAPVTPLSGGSNGGVISIGGNGGSVITIASSSLASSENVSSPLRLSGQLSARDVPATCEDSVKVNGVCPSQGTLDTRQVPATSADMFSIDDPYTCGGNLKGKVMNTNSKTVKYEFFKNGSSIPAFSYDVPVKADGTFELVIDYNIVPEDTYKIVYSAKNNNGTVVSDSIEEFVTNNCTGVNALKYYANKTVRTGGQGIAPIAMVLLGLLALAGAIRFAFAKPRIN